MTAEPPTPPSPGPRAPDSPSFPRTSSGPAHHRTPTEPELPEGNNWHKDTAHCPEPLTPFGWSVVHAGSDTIREVFDQTGLLILGLEEKLVGGEFFVRVLPAFGLKDPFRLGDRDNGTVEVVQAPGARVSKHQRHQSVLAISPRAVPGAGIEPARSCDPRVLSPLRLPVSPPGPGATRG